jgi:hypothetical protein
MRMLINCSASCFSTPVISLKPTAIGFCVNIQHVTIWSMLNQYVELTIFHQYFNLFTKNNKAIPGLHNSGKQPYQLGCNISQRRLGFTQPGKVPRVTVRTVPLKQTLEDGGGPRPSFS